MEALLIINCLTSPIIIGLIVWIAFKAQKSAHKAQLEFETKKLQRSLKMCESEIRFLYTDIAVCLSDRIEGSRYTLEEVDRARERMAFTIKERIKREDAFNNMLAKL